MDNIKEYNIIRIKGDKISNEEDIVIRECPFTIVLNEKKIVTLPCSPDCLGNLAIGYLYSEGYIDSISQIQDITIDEDKGIANISISNINKTNVSKMEKIENQFPIEIQSIKILVDQFNKKSELFKNTGGVHSCALCSKEDIIVFKEDIGRHNAMDKVLGQALVQNIDIKDKILLTSGRISTEILSKVAKSQVPIIVSISAPTDLAIEMARELNITLIGFARGEKMNMYSGFPSLKI